MPRTYTSTASVFLDPLAGNPYSPTTPSSRTEQLAALTTEAGIVLTDDVISEAASSATEDGVNIEPVRPNTITEVPSNSQVIDISFSAEDPDTARVGAQALATAFLAYRGNRAETVRAGQTQLLEQRRAAVNVLLSTASQQLDGIADKQSAAAIDLQQQIGLYAQQLAQVQIEEATVASADVSPGIVLSPASTPDRPDGLNTMLVGLVALMFFAALGVLAALFAEHADRRVRDEEDVIRWGAPQPLGDIGIGSRGAPDILRALPAMETALGKRGAAVFVGLGQTGSVVEPATGFARALALSGKRVCVIIATPEVGLAGVPEMGLSDLLDGSRGVDELDELYVSKGRGVRVLLPGSNPNELPSLVQGPLCSTVIDKLLPDFDAVLVATTWGDPVTATRFARSIGTVVLVAERQRTRGSTLLTVSGALAQVGAVVKGTVLTDADTRRAEGESVPEARDALAPATTNKRP